MEKFGAARVRQMEPRMIQTFAEEGLPYSLGGLTGSTMDSHRLLCLAEQTQGPAAQNRLVEELFNNYFGEGKFINDPGVLKAAAVKAGLDGAVAAECIADPASYRDEVDRQYATFARGVTGVPHFAIDGFPPLSGAQDVQTFARLLKAAAAKASSS